MDLTSASTQTHGSLSPGLTQQLSKETGVELDTKYGDGISTVDGDHWTHVDDARERLSNIKIVK